MVPDLGDFVAAWPFAASLAAAARARSVRESRRRTALNEALHELRRPLQALALSMPAGGEDDVLRMAAAALERLEREVNGEPATPTLHPVAAKPLTEAAVARWGAAAAAAGGSLRLVWRAGEPVLRADRGQIAQALDNLLVNAIEHGGPRIELEARTVAGDLRIAVRDSGPRAGERGRLLPGPGARPLALVSRPSQGRRGHGLRVVRRIAAEHGGRFELRRSGARTEAMLELPLRAERGRA